MNTIIHEWAVRYGVPPYLIVELQKMLMAASLPDNLQQVSPGESESTVQKRVRVEAAQKGCILWRNQVGAAFDERGVPVRFGLANDSRKMNQKVKSSDLVGIRPVRITNDMVGSTIGQFIARETKPESWVYKGTDREVAQLQYHTIVQSLGGDAMFANSVGTI